MCARDECCIYIAGTERVGRLKFKNEADFGKLRYIFLFVDDFDCGICCVLSAV